LRAKWVKENPERASRNNTNAVRAWIDRGTPGVYLVTCKEGLYVGASGSIQARTAQHTSMSNNGIQVHKNVTVLSWRILEEIEDPEERRLREIYWIHKLRPNLNIKHNPDVKEKRNRKK